MDILLLIFVALATFFFFLGIFFVITTCHEDRWYRNHLENRLKNLGLHDLDSVRK